MCLAVDDVAEESIGLVGGGHAIVFITDCFLVEMVDIFVGFIVGDLDQGWSDWYCRAVDCIVIFALTELVGEDIVDEEIDQQKFHAVYRRLRYASGSAGFVDFLLRADIEEDPIFDYPFIF